MRMEIEADTVELKLLSNAVLTGDFFWLWICLCFGKFRTDAVAWVAVSWGHLKHELVWIYCLDHVGLLRNKRADNLASKASIFCALIKSRGLMNLFNFGLWLGKSSIELVRVSTVNGVSMYLISSQQGLSSSTSYNFC